MSKLTPEAVLKKHVPGECMINLIPGEEPNLIVNCPLAVIVIALEAYGKQEKENFARQFFHWNQTGPMPRLLLQELSKIANVFIEADMREAFVNGLAEYDSDQYDAEKVDKLFANFLKQRTENTEG